MADESIRELLEANITAVESGTTPSVNSAPTPAPAAPTPPAGTPPAAPSTVSGTPAPAPVTGTPAPGAPATPAPEGTTPKPGETATDKTTQNIGTVATQKAPGTWTPAAREHWNSLPEGVRDEVIKREREVSRAMTQSTTARKFQQDFNQLIQPHLAHIQAENNGNVFGTIQQMFNVGTVFRTGSVAAKADLVANLCKQFGIDLTMLDQSLDKLYNGGQGGQQQPQQSRGVDPNEIQRLVQQQMAPLLQQQRAASQAMMQEISAEVDNDLDSFAANHEFFNDLKDEMADVIEMAQRRGVNMTLTEAYERATLLSAPVRAVIEQRKAASASQQSHVIAQQARSAAFGVQNSAETTTTNLPAGDSIRDAIERSIAHHSGRIN